MIIGLTRSNVKMIGVEARVLLMKSLVNNLRGLITFHARSVLDLKEMYYRIEFKKHVVFILY